MGELLFRVLRWIQPIPVACGEIVSCCCGLHEKCPVGSALAPIQLLTLAARSACSDLDVHRACCLDSMVGAGTAQYEAAIAQV